MRFEWPWGLPLFLILAIGSGVGSAPAASASEERVLRGAKVVSVGIRSDWDGDLRDLPEAELWLPEDSLREADGADVAVDRAEDADAADFSRPIFNVEGIEYMGGIPPDPVGDVGREYYVQASNAADASGDVRPVMAVYDKTGDEVRSPIHIDTIGGFCPVEQTDPVVVYDHLADRWVLSLVQIADRSTSSFALCVFVSKTADPIRGGWYVYHFASVKSPDYQKLVVWPDAYYVGFFDTDATPPGPGLLALDREALLRGANTVRMVQPTVLPPNYLAFPFQMLLPADLDGPQPDPAWKAPATFVRQKDDEIASPPGSRDPNHDFLEIWSWKIDWNNLANSMLSGPHSISVTEFSSNISDPDGYKFESVTTPWWRAQYRNVEDHEKMLLTTSTSAVINQRIVTQLRWYELRKGPGADPTSWRLHQEGVAPDAVGIHRWLGSIAADRSGNVALGYTFHFEQDQQNRIYPTLAYTGRLAGDPLGQMTQPETILGRGEVAIRSDNDGKRLGDYASMNVDPVDDCTFWFTGEYSPNTADDRGATRIAAFRFAGCEILQGIVWNDPEHDGEKPEDLPFCQGSDTRDCLIAREVVYLDTNRNGQFDRGTDPSTETRPTDGRYELPVSSVAPGEYELRHYNPLDWLYSAPEDGVFSVEVGGPTLGPLDFGVYCGGGRGRRTAGSAVADPCPGTDRGQIWGIVERDGDGDGLTEEAVDSLTIYLDKDGNDRYTPPPGGFDDVSTTTNSNGYFQLTDLPAGQHVVRMDSADADYPTGDNVVYPQSQEHTIILDGSEGEVENADFRLHCVLGVNCRQRISFSGSVWYSRSPNPTQPPGTLLPPCPSESVVPVKDWPDCTLSLAEVYLDYDADDFHDISEPSDFSDALGYEVVADGPVAGSFPLVLESFQVTDVPLVQVYPPSRVHMVNGATGGAGLHFGIHCPAPCLTLAGGVIPERINDDATIYHVRDLRSNGGRLQQLDLGISTAHEVCGVVGVDFAHSYLHEDPPGDDPSFEAYVWPVGDSWRLFLLFQTYIVSDPNVPRASWSADVLCLSKEVAADQDLGTRLPFFTRWYFFSITDDPVDKDLGLSSASHVCGTFGYFASEADINENGTGEPLEARLYDSGGTWHVIADLRSHNPNEIWAVEVLCASRDIAEIAGVGPPARLGPMAVVKKFEGIQDLPGDAGTAFGLGTTTAVHGCGIVGFDANAGDIDEDKPDVRVFTATTVEGGGGALFGVVEFVTHLKHEVWGVDALCLSKTVPNFNRPPTLSLGGAWTLMPGVRNELPVDAPDADGHPIVNWEVEGLPAGTNWGWIQAGNNRRILHWTPGKFDVGFHDLRFTVTDSRGGQARAPVRAEVLVNHPPTIEVTDAYAVAGRWFGTVIIGRDEDPQPLTLTMSGAPEGALFGENPGPGGGWALLFQVPASGYPPAYWVTFTLSDGVDSVSRTIRIPVFPADLTIPAIFLRTPLPAGPFPPEFDGMVATRPDWQGNITQLRWRLESFGAARVAADPAYCQAGPPNSGAVLDCRFRVWRDSNAGPQSVQDRVTVSIEGEVPGQAPVTDSFDLFFAVRPPRDLAAWYPFDEPSGGVATDLLARNDGLHRNGPQPRPATVGFGLGFDGVDDYVEVSDHEALDVGRGDFSIVFWIVTDQTSGVSAILDKRVGQYPYTGYHVFLLNGQVGLQLADASGYSNFTAGARVANGLPHLVAISVDRDGLGKLYLDGRLAGTFDPTRHSASLDNDVAMHIGRRSFESTGHFKGLLDELQIFRGVLTAGEVVAIFQAGSTGLSRCVQPPVGATAWYPFDEASGTTAADILGGNHATHRNGPVPVAGRDGYELRFDGEDDSVDAADAQALDFGTGDLAISFWITTRDQSVLSVVLDKRLPSFPYTSYHVFLARGFLGLQLADAQGYTNYISSAFVADGARHFVAMTVDRDGGGRFDVDGTTVYTFNPTARAGSLDNDVGLSIGKRSFDSLDLFEGVLDELEVSKRALRNYEVKGIVNLGQCKR